MPPPLSVVLVGSSILAQWTDVASHLAPLPVTNRAVSGTFTADQLTRFDLTFKSVTPAAVLYYCGSNDLKAGLDPHLIFANFAAFDLHLRSTFPSLPLIFLASLRTPDRRPWWPRVEHYNTLVHHHLLPYPDRHYFDLQPALHDASGETLPNLFQPDQLHLLHSAYVRFGHLLHPFLHPLLLPASKSRL